MGNARINSICRWQVARMQRVNALIEAGTLRTHEMRNGVQVDTSEETRQENEFAMAELSSLIDESDSLSLHV